MNHSIPRDEVYTEAALLYGNYMLEQGKQADKNTLYSVFSTIPLDIQGSNLANTGWMPYEKDISYMGEESYKLAIEECNAKNAKVLFKNVHLKCDSCDCGDGYGCSHGSYVYEITVTNGDKSHTLELDDSGILAYNEQRQTMIPEKEATVYDFYRMCELVGIKLELTDYAVSLLKLNELPSPVNNNKS